MSRQGFKRNYAKEAQNDNNGQNVEKWDVELRHFSTSGRAMLFSCPAREKNGRN